ncbi:MAG: response regulator transcription factor [Bdellovibrionales bacterium]|nr:response regulator transcription factor [Bdellovibrionales bacterium]
MTNSKPKLLIVDDDPDIILTLSDALESDYQILSSNCGKQAIEIAKLHKPALAIVDCHMPEGDGHFFCSQLRKIAGISDLPILIISGDIEIASKLKLYDAGADDYIAKPFSFPEIKAKIKANLRRKLDQAKGGLAKVELDMNSQEIRYAGQSKKLSKVEAKILNCLLSCHGSLVKRSELYKSVWIGQAVTARTVDVHIANLRKKLPDQLTIESRYGLGYVLRERLESAS